MKLVLVSGYSGSGKSVALKALEDAGYFAVDNLPVAMVEGLLRELAGVRQIAVAIDIRAGESVGTLPALVSALRDRGVDCRLLFIEASDEAIARRFAETRRPHPLAERITGGVQACIGVERRLLADIAELGHRMDTSGVNANRLRDWIKDWLQLDRSRISLTLQSFGFKHGIPMDADMVFDVRFLPNPYYDTTLRPLTGRDEPVKKFLQADADVAKFVDDVVGFLERWLPSFVRDHRAAVTVAIGCTGGQHRSVYISEQLAARFGEKQQVLVRHRDIH
ncbi:MAG: RNase adapter RapZ [Burkholderiales bacterium]|nr:RNase adapter RapZ [Rhodocyclaceae bacterium]